MYPFMKLANEVNDGNSKNTRDHKTCKYASHNFNENRILGSDLSHLFIIPLLIIFILVIPCYRGCNVPVTRLASNRNLGVNH